MLRDGRRKPGVKIDLNRKKSSSKDDLSHVQYARNTFPLLAAGCAPHLAYLSSLSLGGRTYSGLGWRIFSLSRFHPSGVPTVGHSRESGIIILCGTEYWVLVHSSTFIVPCQCSVFSVHFFKILFSIQYLGISLSQYLSSCCVLAVPSSRQSW